MKTANDLANALSQAGFPLYIVNEARETGVASIKFSEKRVTNEMFKAIVKQGFKSDASDKGDLLYIDGAL